jgi:hypothetical protein
MSKLCDIAYNNLLGNIIEINNKKYITAGSCQFHTIWIRDSLFCMDTLHKLGLEKILNNIIDLYLKNLKKDENNTYHGPKCFDNINPEWRTVKASIRHVFGLPRIKDPIVDLNPHMYKDSRNSVAIDSNILICMASLLTGRHEKNMSKIIKLLKWYKKDNYGLIIQDGFSDFKDSQRREGVVFNINLLYYVCLKRYKKKGYEVEEILGVSLPLLKTKIIRTFFDSEKGIFKTQKNKEFICLLDNLLAIKYNFIDRKKLYENLKKSKLWHGSKLKIPGFATYPNNTDTHIQVSIGGLSNYHNDIYWFWLMAFAGQISFKMKDNEEGKRIHLVLEKIAKRDGCVSEIYKPEKDFPIFETLTYSSERPFTMAASYAIELCEYLK